MEGVEQAKLALALDPLSAYTHALYALTCITAGKTAVGLEMGRRAVELDSESFMARWALQMALWLSGHFEASVATAESALAMSGRHPWAMTVLALTLADWGKLAEVDAIYCELQARARRGYISPALLAIVACAAAREDEAVRHAREAYEIRDPSSPHVLSRYAFSAARLYGCAPIREIIAQMGRSDWLREPLPSRAPRGA